MRVFLSAFALQLRAAARSWAVALIFAAALAWTFAVPAFVTTDGTADGAHAVFTRYSLWGAFVLVVTSLAASGAGALSADRAAHRLQLTLVRPASRFLIALARTAALVAVGAAVLGACSLAVLFRADASRPCWHVLRPQMESPVAEAEKVYERYMASPETPDEIKKARRSDVVALLAHKSFDRYETVRSGSRGSWRFDVSRIRHHDEISVRLRFSGAMGLRQDFAGEFAMDGLRGSVSNVTQSVLVIPLSPAASAASEAGETTPAAERGVLEFLNTGRESVMMRPRRDICLLHASSGDVFAVNLASAWLVMVCMLAATVAFAVFLGAGLGRSTAVFTVSVALLLAAASPAVVDGYSDQLDKSVRDRFGLAVARFAGAVTRPLGSFDPIGELSDDERVEHSETVRAVVLDLVAIPALLALLSALVMPLKQEGDV